MAPTWYLGPLGDLRALSCPDTGITMNPVRYGGVFQGLSGARSTDTMGIRTDYGFAWASLDADEWYWLESLYTRSVRGPHRLIDPTRKNRLSIGATSLRVTRGTANGVFIDSPFVTTDASSAALMDIPALSKVVFNWSATARNIVFDTGRPTPVFPLETVTGSVHTGASSGSTYNACQLRFDFVTRTGSIVATENVGFTPTPTWARVSITRQAPPGAAGVTMSVVLGANVTGNQVYLNAPQIESGPAPTKWQPGGAAPVVILDQLTSGSRRWPLRDIQMTISEA